jgi:hypothetical protein
MKNDIFLNFFVFFSDHENAIKNIYFSNKIDLNICIINLLIFFKFENV